MLQGLLHFFIEAGMTTIVGDWNMRILVSDSQFSDDDTGIKYFDEKVVPIDGGWLGVAGNWCDCDKVVDYINKKSKRKPKLKSDSSFIKLTQEGLFYCGDDLEWEKAKTFMAIGSGAMAAEVCMRMGLSAEEAVKWACNVDLKSHEPIKTYAL
jgi:20S proteasome alpha/beta subunit